MDLPHEAKAYAEADFNEVNAAFVERLLELTPDRSAAWAVDLGAGPGDIAARVLSARPQWRLAAADAAKAMLDYALRRAKDDQLGDLRPVLCDAKATPFVDGVFDVVFSNSILHHVADPHPFWLEIKRIAKPRAVLFLRDLARPPSEAEAHRLVDEHAGSESELLQEEFYRSLLAAYTPHEVEDQLARAGLGQLEVIISSDRHLDVIGHL